MTSFHFFYNHNATLMGRLLLQMQILMYLYIYFFIFISFFKQVLLLIEKNCDYLEITISNPICLSNFAGAVNYFYFHRPPLNFTFLQIAVITYLGLIDMFSANQNAEIGACILLR